MKRTLTILKNPDCHPPCAPCTAQLEKTVRNGLKDGAVSNWSKKKTITKEEEVIIAHLSSGQHMPGIKNSAKHKFNLTHLMLSQTLDRNKGGASFGHPEHSIIHQDNGQGQVR